MVCMPDLWTLGRHGDDVQVRDLQGKMIAHCENMGDRMAILDSPPDLLPQEILEWRMNTAGYDSKMTALYYPWIEVMDPLTNRPIDDPAVGPRGRRVVPHRRARRGVHKAPANEVVMGANGLALPDHARRSRAASTRSASTASARSPAAASASGAPAPCRATRSGATSTCAGSSTSSASRSSSGTQWIVFEPNDERLWLQLRNAVVELPHPRSGATGALFGNTPTQAFFVKCDAETNPPEVIEAGQVVCEIGIAPVKPAEFVIFRLSQFSGGGGGEVEE